MARGENTILRESSKPEATVHILLKRNATDTELLQAQVQQPGQTFQVDGHTYRITDVERDTIHRLIAIGKLENI